MDTDRNLLFGVLALQADLIDPKQFVEACLLWTSRKDVPLADLLVERGWIMPDDKAHVDYLLGRKLHKHGDDPRASLAAIPDDVKRSLAALEDDEIQHSLANLPRLEAVAHQDATVDDIPRPKERYARLRLQATGGIGRVWQAHDRELGRDVALKELRPERAEHATLWTRFLQEAQITGQLEHPGIVPVYELSRRPNDGQPFYTMRFVKGRTLSEAARAYHQKRLAGQADALELPALLNAFVTVCNTVAYAHSRGVIHRDLKGQNVILGDFGEVVVLDWGLAKIVGCPEGEVAVPSLVLDAAGAEGSGYTVQGQAMGTPGYMAPEQAEGRLDLIDRRTDVYGLGAILYEVLTGQPPFTGSSTEEVLRRVREEDPVPPRQRCAEVPPALEAVCLRALAKQPSARYPSASEPAQEVQLWQDVQRRQAEEALRRQTEILQSILNSMSDGVVVADETGKLILWNRGAEEIMNMPVQQVPPEQWQERYGCYLLDRLTPCPVEQMPLSRAMRGEAVDDAELFICHDQLPEGIILSINARPLKDKEGILGGGVIVFRDVTARKKAEEELAHERYLLRSLMDTIPDKIYFKDLDSRFIRVNKDLAERFRLSDPVEALGKTDADFFAQEHAQQALADEREILRTGCPLVAKEEKETWCDGRVTWVSSTKVPLREPDGHIIGTFGISRDITEWKRAEETLRQSEERYRSVIAAMQDGIVLLDADGSIRECNAAAERILGLSAEQMMGRTPHDPRWRAIHEDGSPFPGETHPPMITLRTGQPCTDVVMGVHKPDGTLTWLSINSQPLFRADGQTLAGVVASFEDITDRKRTEELLRQTAERLACCEQQLQQLVTSGEQQARPPDSAME